MNNGNVTYQTGDEHTVNLIKQNQSLCQKTMKIFIEKENKDVDKKAQKSHERIDSHAVRLGRLDDTETGKVTIMWEDRKAFTNYMRNSLIAIIVLSLLGILPGFFFFINYIGR